MERALALAQNSPRRNPNPRVGCVILDASGAIVAEGWHRGAGTAHAEVDAIARLPREYREPAAAAGLTLVVTLEPCNHTGRTGPCAEAIVAAGIGAVVYGSTDPGRHSRGGADRLRASGVQVTGGVQTARADALNDGWLAAARLGRPHVTVKWAQSLDGRSAAADGSSRWVSGPSSRADVHERRALADAIVVGTGTLLADDPALTARRPDGSLCPQQPVPVVLGARAVPEGARIRSHPEAYLQRDGEDIGAVLAELGERGLHRVFVEGGATIAAAFLRAGLADELLVYVAPLLLGAEGLPALGSLAVPTIGQARQLRICDARPLGEDWLFTAVPADAAKEA